MKINQNSNTGKYFCTIPVEATTLREVFSLVKFITINGEIIDKNSLIQSDDLMDTILWDAETIEGREITIFSNIPKGFNAHDFKSLNKDIIDIQLF